MKLHKHSIVGQVGCMYKSTKRPEQVLFGLNPRLSSDQRDFTESMYIGMYDIGANQT